MVGGFGCVAQVEALGRNPQLEALGYFGKQSYWIRCRSCVNKPHRTATDASSPSPHKEAGSENGGQGGQEVDAEPGRDNDDDLSGAGRRGQGAAEPRDSDRSESESESESDSEPEREPKPEPMPFAVALTLLQDHPAAKAAFLQPR